MSSIEPKQKIWCPGKHPSTYENLEIRRTKYELEPSALVQRGVLSHGLSHGSCER